MVLDVLKPHEPSILEVASRLSDLEGVEGVDVTVVEVDSKVETIKATIKGKDVIFDEVEGIIGEMGASIHSIDKVSCGSEIVEEVSTPQD